MDDHEKRQAKFDIQLDLVIKSVLSDENGVPYGWFKCGDHISGQYQVDWDRLEIHFSPFTGPLLSVQAVTHELGHLMVARDEGIGEESWGLENPYIFMSGIAFDRIAPVEKFPHVRLEAKVWAWQYLIEVASGIRDARDPLPLHPEVRYLRDGIEYVSDDDRAYEIAEKMFAEELEKLKKTDWQSKMKTRFASMSGVLAQCKSAHYDYDIKSPDIILREWSEDLGESQKNRILLLDVGQSYYEVRLIMEDNLNDVQMVETSTHSKDLKRCERFFDIAVATNTISTPAPSHLEVSGDAIDLPIHA
jgi:hypothetical protein